MLSNSSILAFLRLPAALRSRGNIFPASCPTRSPPLLCRTVGKADVLDAVLEELTGLILPASAFGKPSTSPSPQSGPAGRRRPAGPKCALLLRNKLRLVRNEDPLTMDVRPSALPSLRKKSCRSAASSLSPAPYVASTVSQSGNRQPLDSATRGK